MNELGLVRYDAMCTAIAVCVQVDEVKDIRDKARAMEVYAAQALNKEAERKAAEVRIRAERRVGELLKEMKQTGQRTKQGGDKKSKSDGSILIRAQGATFPPAAPKRLSDLGITPDQSSQWQKLAEIPEKEFEAEIAKPYASTEGLLQKHSPRPPLETPRIDPAALNAWGRLRDFESGIVIRPLPALFGQMTVSMQDDVVRIVPVVIAWLEHFVESRRPTRKKA